MKKENKALLGKYIICFAVASLITVAVFWSKGFFAHSVGVNLQILADGFFVSGILVTLFAGMMFISGEGALIGIGFVLKSVVLTFIPMGRAKHERYADYRARKLEERKKSTVCIRNSTGTKSTLLTYTATRSSTTNIFFRSQTDNAIT